MRLSILVPVDCGNSQAHAAVLEIFAEIHAWLRRNANPQNYLIDGPFPGKDSFSVTVEIKREPPMEGDLMAQLEDHLQKFVGRNQLPLATIARD